MDVYSRTPIGVFNPHIWPPNLEGVRGTPTVTRLITIDRQLFYEQCEESIVSTLAPDLHPQFCIKMVAADRSCVQGDYSDQVTSWPHPT